jgi:hypothetical protein
MGGEAKKTAADRFRRALKRIAEWCRLYRYEPVREQWAELKLKLSGHFGYLAITGNTRVLRNFRHHVVSVWRKWLSCRAGVDNRGREFRLLARYPLPQPRIRPATIT